MVRKVAVFVVAATLLAIGLVVVIQWSSDDPQPASRNVESAPADDLVDGLAQLDPTTWVRRHLPQGTSPGFNLILFRRRVPLVIDMNGAIVHAWPNVRAVGRVRLNRDGRLAVIGTDNLVKEYDWEGNLRWRYRLPGKGDFPHHDMIHLANGHLLVVARDGATHADYLLELEPGGEAVWEWRSYEHRQVFPDWNPRSKDPTHFNSVYELPPNRWFDDGDERFRPGNLLVSARTIDTIFIVDRTSGEVVWQHKGDLDYQHEASMIGAGEPSEGLILVFNNGFHNRRQYRRSIVQAIDPTSNEVVWDYGSEHLFSSVGGTVHALPGGNLLICSSQGGRAFELDAGREIVWEWAPPYLPMRLERLPYDHCPQLARLPIRDGVEKTPVDGYEFVDIDLYKLGLVNDTERRDIGGRERRVMSWNTGCRRLAIPPDATLKTEFGFDEGLLGATTVAARFRLTVALDGPPATWLDVTIDSASDELWQVETFALDELAYQSVEMCIATDVDGDGADLDRIVVWSVPIISSSTQRPTLKARDRRLTDEELRLREQQLEALGYVN